MSRILRPTSVAAGAFLILVGAISGCDYNANATAPSALQADTPAPNLRTVGSINFTNCGSSAGCSFDGNVTNDGPGCVSNVRGETHLLDGSGKDLEVQSWTVNGRLRPGQQVPFSGCCFSSSAVNAHASEHTDIKYNPIQCI